jgi:hypothetical protein
MPPKLHLGNMTFGWAQASSFVDHAIAGEVRVACHIQWCAWVPLHCAEGGEALQCLCHVIVSLARLIPPPIDASFPRTIALECAACLPQMMGMFLTAGGKHFDTARIYAGGKSEEMAGDIMVSDLSPSLSLLSLSSLSLSLVSLVSLSSQRFFVPGSRHIHVRGRPRTLSAVSRGSFPWFAL